ncbi:MAG: glycosyltransferase [Nitrososphaerota archaeon]
MIYANKPIGTIGYLGGIMAVPEAFAWSWGQLIQYNTEYLCRPGEYVHYVRSKISLHDVARNSLVDQMLGDWLLMLDTDHSFDPDLASRMLNRLEQYDIDVLVGAYTSKSPPYVPILYVWSDDVGFQHIGKMEGAGIYRIDAAGAGCLMARRHVFDRIRDELGEAPFSRTPPFGEDMSFFLRLKKLGIGVWVDPSIECHHLEVRPTSLDMWDSSTFPLDAYVGEGLCLDQ